MEHSFFDSTAKISRKHIIIVRNDIFGSFYEISDFLEKRKGWYQQNEKSKEL
jgi:hypothetical protein